MGKNHERPGQKEYGEGVKRLHRKEFKALHCRVCPLGRTGFDRNEREIPLEAHHTSMPYAVDRNQDPQTGSLICSIVHRRKVHQGTGLSRIGLELMNKFIRNPKVTRYDIRGLECPYKDDDNVE